ncbi:8-oxoguanine DNA glycosylase OGG fold protein [Streptomyces sp. TE33382]
MDAAPRHTDAALSDTRIQAAPRTTRDSVRSGDLRLVYSQFVLAGVRRSFATKWLAAVDDRGSGEARALIPDDRVFRSLNALGWSGRKAAGTRHWPTRYATCVSAMHGWAGSIGVTAEWLEWLLFHLNGQVHAQECERAYRFGPAAPVSVARWGGLGPDPCRRESEGG